MKTFWVATGRYYTVDGIERQMYLPLPYADIADIEDTSRVFETQEECEEWCEQLNKQMEGVKV